MMDLVRGFLLRAPSLTPKYYFPGALGTQITYGPVLPPSWSGLAGKVPLKTSCVPPGVVSSQPPCEVAQPHSLSRLAAGGWRPVI